MTFGGLLLRKLSLQRHKTQLVVVCLQVSWHLAYHDPKLRPKGKHTHSETHRDKGGCSVDRMWDILSLALSRRLECILAWHQAKWSRRVG